MAKEARYYQVLEKGKIKCSLCPHYCLLENNELGKCHVRKSYGGKLVSEVYGQARGISFDPIEKKPLYHFFPGSQILSLGTPGCNLQCFFCQNWDLSQINKVNFQKERSPDEILEISKTNQHNLGIAFTYSEPTIFYEYMYDTAVLFKEKGLKTCMISNGFINEKPLLDLIPFMDAFNIDLKAFSNSFYREHTKSSLIPVLNSLKTIAKHNKHLELSFLVIPGLNDDSNEFDAMLEWIISELGKSTILHINRYFPNYKSKIAPTPIEKLEEFFDTASKKLDYVYIGNYSGNSGQNTVCPDCGSVQINREHNKTKVYLDSDGKCSNCGVIILNMM